MKSKNTKWLIVLFLILIFTFIYVCIATGWIEHFDNILYENILKLRSPILTNIIICITNIGGTTSVCGISLILIMIMFIMKKRKYAIGITLNILISSLSYTILKSIFQRPRPPINERLIEEVGYSFPSGHSTNNMAFYGFIIYLTYKNIKNKILRNVIIMILTLLIILIGFSRIYLRVHYPSDVIAGFCLGIICIIVFVSTIFNKISEENK